MKRESTPTLLSPKIINKCEEILLEQHPDANFTGLYKIDHEYEEVQYEYGIKKNTLQYFILLTCYTVKKERGYYEWGFGIGMYFDNDNGPYLFRSGKKYYIKDL